MTKKNKFRVVVARVVLPIFTIWSCLFPSQSYAFVPATIGGYGLPAGSVIGAGGAGAVAGGFNLIAGAGLIAIGAAIGYWAVGALAGTARIPSGSSPVAVPAPTPPQTTAPTSTYTYTGTFSGVQRSGPTSGDVCAQLNAYGVVGGVTYWTFTCSDASLSGQYHFSNGTTGDPVPGTMTRVASGTTCPAGYTSGANGCELTDPRAAEPDNNCDYSRSGGSYGAITDPDCGSAPAPVVGANGELAFGGLTEAGEPARIGVTPSTNGGSCAKTDVQKVVGGVTVVETTIVCTDADGNVISVTSTVSTGTVPTDGTAPSPGTEVTPVVFPTDYARQGEAAAATQTIADADTAWRAGDRARFEDKLGTAPTAEVVPNSTVPISIGTVSFASSSVCPADIPFTMFSTSYSISYGPMCDLMSYMRPLFLAFGAMSCAFIFIGGLKT